MLARLPPEITDLIINRLSVSTLRAIALVCSALRLPAQLLLFRTIRIVVKTDHITPHHARLILPYPHLLQYASRLIVTRSFVEPEMPTVSANSFWSYLPTMYRLIYIQLDINLVNHPTFLPMLEGLGSAREIEIKFMRAVGPGVPISQDPLPVHFLSFPVDASGDQVTRLLLKNARSPFANWIYMPARLKSSRYLFYPIYASSPFVRNFYSLTRISPHGFRSCFSTQPLLAFHWISAIP